MSDLAFGLLFGVSLGNLVAVVMIFVVAAKALKLLEEIRDMLKDRKGN